MLICPPDGDSDWMDPKGGAESVENLRKAGNGNGKMYIVPHAGHHRTSSPLPALPCWPNPVLSAVYLDNPKATNDLLIKELDRDLRN